MKKIINKLSSLATTLLITLSINANALEALNVIGQGSDGYVAENTVDNKLTTRWSANGVDGSQWLQYQFKESDVISAINIAFYKGDTRRTFFEIHLSDNGSDWTVAFSGSSSGLTTGLETFSLDKVITDQYIRIVGLGSTKGTWNNITQVTFTKPHDANTLCRAGCELGELGKTEATASSDDGHVAANVLDDSNSYWSAKGIGEWIRLDIKKLQPINGVMLKFYKGDDRESKFSIEVSTDGTNWLSVIDEAVSAGGDLQFFKFETTTARYVRYTGYGNSGSIWSGAWNSLIRFDVLPDLEKVAKPLGYSTPNTSSEVILPVTSSLSTKPSLIEGCAKEGKMELNGDCIDWLDIYEVEHGELAENAYLVASSPIEMKFNALTAQHETSNGNGWRHELKIKSSGDYRVGMTDVYEEFKARININLSNGAKTIVAQHHAATTATITKLYVSDLNERGFGRAPDGRVSDSIANNGVFDVYIRLAKEDGSGETKHLLTTIKSGESFDFEEINDHGVITVKINGQALPSITVNDSSESYFKFGNYHQAQNPTTGEKVYNKSDWPDFYAKYFTESEVIFTNVSYIRNVD